MKKLNLLLLTFIFSAGLASAQNNAISFNGVDSYIKVDADASLNMYNSSFTIEAWIRSSQNNSSEVIFFEYGTWQTGTYQMTSDQQDQIKVNFEGRSSADGAEATVNWTDGNWHHFAGVFDNAADKIRLYKDGVLLVEVNEYNAPGNAILPLYIGARGGTEKFAEMEIDEIRIWNDARSQAEIQDKMYVELAGTETGLVAYYNMNDVDLVTNTLTDNSSNTNDGTLYNITADDIGPSGSTSAAIPFTDGFEDGSLQSYWTTGGSGTPAVSTDQAYSGTYALNFNTPVSSSNYVEVELDAVTDPTLSFWYYFFNYFNFDMSVDIYTNGSWTTGIWTDAVTSSDDDLWLQANIDLSAYDTESGNFKLRFNSSETQNSSGYYIYLDDVWVGGPSSPNPNNSSDNALSGTLTWDHALNVSTYDVKFGEAGNMTTVVSGATVSGTSGSYAFSGLDYATEYEWQIIYYKADATQIDGPVWSFYTLFGTNAGTEADPYEISAVSDLISFSQNSGYWQYHYIQTADIAFNASETLVDWDGDGSATWDTEDQKGFSPIGNSTTKFTGSYDGHYDGIDHKIENLFINRPSTDNVGFIGYTSYANISNLELVDVNIEGDRQVGGLIGYQSLGGVDNVSVSGSVAGNDDQVGGLIGFSYNATINNVSSSATVVVSSGTNYVGGLIGSIFASGSSLSNSFSSATVITTWSQYVGGLVGNNSGVIENCITNSILTGEGDNKQVGGLVGRNSSSGIISDCSSSSDVNGYTSVGGLVGENDEGDISSSFSTGNVSSISYSVGGLVGYDNGTISYSYSNCEVETDDGNNVGGLVGAAGSSSNISNCYSTGSVSGDWRVGGLVGKNYTDNISSSYSTGSVVGNNYVGGLVGDNSGTVSNSFWDTETSGQESSDGGTGKTTAEMKTASTFSSWTFNADNWAISNGNSRPYLAWQDVAVDNSYPDDVGATVVQFPEGNIHNHSASAITMTYGYMYKQDEPPSWDNSTKVEMGTDVSVSSGADQSISATTIISLTPTTSYYARSYATDGSTVWYGETVKFTTSTTSSMTWDGSESSNWNTAGNWSDNTLPTHSHNITIPSGVTNDPVIGTGFSADCNNLTVNSGATLTMDYDGTLITYGTITNNGTININYSATDDTWAYVSPPNNNTTANIFLDDYLQSWDEPNAEWTEITDENTPLTPVKGYILYPPSSKSDFTFTGTPNTGEQSIDITYTNNSSGNDGANLVGNPYPSSIDWDAVSGYGAKYTWNGTEYVERAEDGTGSGNQYVYPMEGFFIVTSSDGTFSLDNSMRAHPVGPMKSGKEKSLTNGLVLTASNGSYEDELWLVFNDQASENFELQRDAWKLLSGTEGISQLYSFSPDGMMSIDVRPITSEIQLGFQNNKSGTYSIGIKEIADLQKAVLEDTQEDVFHDLTEGDYEFAWENIDSETRFKLHLSTLGIEDEINNEAQNLLIYANKQNIYLKIKEHSDEMDVRVRDITGRILLQKHISKSGTITIPTGLQTGVYVVEVMQDQVRTTQKVFISE